MIVMTHARLPLWLRVLGVGVVLFGLAAAALALSSNVHLVPSVLLLGAFLVPTTFAAFLYGALPRSTVPVSTLALVALIGGLVGLAVAGTFEYATLSRLGVLPLVAVGVIEETAKILAPAMVLWRRVHSEAGALLLGVASGLGFAVFETLGYGFAELLRTGGDVGSVLQLLFMRGLLSPAGHAAWTGLLAVAIWRARQRRTAKGLTGTFVLVVGLHVAWNLLAAMPLYVLVLLASLVIFLRRLRDVRRRGNAPTRPATEPELPVPVGSGGRQQ